MAWIESHESLPGHPKTKRMCRILKIPPVQAVGHLHFLWWWAMNHAQDGVLDRYTAEDIADACSWEGESNEFFSALVTSGFIENTQTGYSIHDWYDYAGKLISLRQKDKERKRISRGKKPESEGSPTDIQRTSNGHLAESIRDLNPNLNQDLNLKEKDNNTSVVVENPYQVFEREGFGTISGYIKDEIDDMSKEYGDKWLCDAMRVSVVKGKRKLSFVRGVLKNWKADGRDAYESAVNELDTKTLTGEEWAKAAGFGGGT